MLRVSTLITAIAATLFAVLLGALAFDSQLTSAGPAPGPAAIGDPACLTNPAGTPTASDTDADHLLDSCEPTVGTTVSDDDSDDDGVQDGIEYGTGTDPLLNTGNYSNPTGDADGDGCNNQKELNTDIGNPSVDFHPGNWWDFYTVDDDDTVPYDPANHHDLSSTLDVLGHFGHQYNGGAYADMYDQGYDRRRLLSPGPPGLLVEGNDGVDLSEVLASLSTFGFGGSGCVPPGPVPAPGGGVFD
jgi:hypothetical protein